MDQCWASEVTQSVEVRQICATGHSLMSFPPRIKIELKAFFRANQMGGGLERIKVFKVQKPKRLGYIHARLKRENAIRNGGWIVSN